jgi:hypothetical protein
MAGEIVVDKFDICATERTYLAKIEMTEILVDFLNAWTIGHRSLREQIHSLTAAKKGYDAVIFAARTVSLYTAVLANRSITPGYPVKKEIIEGNVPAWIVQEVGVLDPFVLKKQNRWLTQRVEKAMGRNGSW